VNGIRAEHFHFTAEQVRDHLRDALAIVDEGAVPTDLRAIAFDKVFNAVSAKQIVVEQVEPVLGVPHLGHG
jgi:hypothetical protein